MSYDPSHSVAHPLFPVQRAHRALKPKTIGLISNPVTKQEADRQ